MTPMLWMVWLAHAPGPTDAPPPPLPTPGTYALHWDAPPGCPSDAQLRADIAALLGREPSGEGTLEVDARVTETPHGVRLMLRSRFLGVEDERSFDAARCKEVADAAVMFLVVALEPGFAGSLPRPNMTSPPPTLPDPPPQEHAPPGDKRRTPPGDASADRRDSGAPPATGHADREGDNSAMHRERRDVAVTGVPPSRTPDAPPLRAHATRVVPSFRLGVGPEYGTLNALTVVLTASVAATWPRWSLQFDGRYLAPRRLPAEGPGALYQFGGLGTRGCARLSGGFMEIPVCIGAMVGLVRGASRELQAAREDHGLWVGPVFSAGLAGQPGLARWWFAIDVGITGYAARFVIDDETALTPFPVNLALTAGVEFGAPRWSRSR